MTSQKTCYRLMNGRTVAGTSHTYHALCVYSGKSYSFLTTVSEAGICYPIDLCISALLFPFLPSYPSYNPPHISFVHSGVCSNYPAVPSGFYNSPATHPAFDPSCSSCCRIFCSQSPASLQSCRANTGHFACYPLLSVLETSNKQVYGEHLKLFRWSYIELLLRYLGGTFKVHPVVPTSARPWNVFSLHHRYQLTVCSSHINWKWT